MRLTRWSLLLGGCLVLAVLTADTALTQRWGGGRGGWGGGRGGGRGMDPNMMFNFMARGKDYLVIAEVTRTRDKDAMTEYAQRKGISNGRLTREQFADYWQDRMANRRNRGGPAGGSPGAPAPGGEDPAKASFDRLDANKDQVLTDSEIPEGLRADLSKWDTNRDGKIQFDEYRAYFQAHPPADAAASGPSLYIVPSPALEELDKRATVYRAGHLPKELQKTWFEEYDTDKDGQVGLYEWKASGRPMAEFRAMDANGDGFVTAEEALRYFKKNPTAFANPAGGNGRGPAAGGTNSGGYGRGPRPFDRGAAAASDGDRSDWRARMGQGKRGPRRRPPESP
jgi:hypothetical protein